MNENIKSQLLQEAKEGLNNVREKIQTKIDYREEKGRSMIKNKNSVVLSDSVAEQILEAHNKVQIENLKQLYPSPYFTRCDFISNSTTKEMYFGKFSFSDENIYSWVTPAATLRFDRPGPASYDRPDGKTQSGIIERKDNYMIVDGKINFYSIENLGSPLELIYQENFTRQKSGFILPEVVEQMEKSQDQIIRAHHRGPLIISGPAGSGKTTLALHRVAYLIQNPETSETFRPDSILVLVQDSGSKQYFSQLLPDLGIKGVSIVTFAEWSKSVLKLESHEYISDYKISELEKYQYEYAKLQAIKNNSQERYNKNIYSFLEKVYYKFLTDDQKKILNWQRENKYIDHFDLTILLDCYQKQHGELNLEKDYYERQSGNQYRKRKGTFPAQYSLIIVDEFQNYLPKQLDILNTCLNNRLKSMIYVGDLSQQTQLGTLSKLADTGIELELNRLVKLEKVYRNTKEILNYIKNGGYEIQIPDQIKHGTPVIEKTFDNTEDEINFVDLELNNTKGDVGILCRDKKYLDNYKKRFNEKTNVHCLTFHETQGVEFESVFLVGPNYNESEFTSLNQDILKEVNKIEKDLKYVALTRAMSKLYVLSK